jgi:serralysin
VPDLIEDLENNDFIDVSQIDANWEKGGNQAFDLASAFDGKPGEAVISYNKHVGATEVAFDVTGDGRPDMVIRIEGDHTDFTNFVL